MGARSRPDAIPALAELRALVGTEFRRGTRRYRLVEVMSDATGLALVLQALDQPPSIQGNQFGDASRLSAPLLTIPLLAADGAQMNPALAQLEPSILRRTGR